ncbi:MAG: hypothetical protein QXU02_00990 [Candidatus Bathyarchaeia archaeon]
MREVKRCTDELCEELGLEAAKNTRLVGRLLFYGICNRVADRPRKPVNLSSQFS